MYKSSKGTTNFNTNERANKIWYWYQCSLYIYWLVLPFIYIYIYMYMYILIPFYTQLLMCGLFMSVGFLLPHTFILVFSLAHYHEHARVKCASLAPYHEHVQVRCVLSHTLSWTWCVWVKCMIRGKHVVLSEDVCLSFYLSSSVWRMTMDEDGWMDGMIDTERIYRYCRVK